MKKNILANIVGNALTAIVFVICIPIYVKHLGVESYGLIGFFASLQIIFSVLDAGLSATLNREFARLSLYEEGAIEQKNLLRTFECIYLGISVFIALLIALLAPFISRHWLSGVNLSSDTVRLVLIQMGVLLALRWPTALYAGGLTGLQKQVIYNMINTGGELVKAIGAIMVLTFYSNSIKVFFYWQIIIASIMVVTLHFILWKNIPLTSEKTRFSKLLVFKNRSFASGMWGIALTVIILTQTDKIILSKILNLQSFGYYALASAIASALYRVISPLSQAIYPRLIQLVHNDPGGQLIKLFHISCQLIAAIVLPISLTIVFFSKEVVLLWTQNPAITEAVHPLLRILIIGIACNALVTIPYMAQLAYGWTKLALYQNIIAIIILIPSIIYLANRYGAYGVVWVWTILNASYIVFSMPVMFSRILKKEIWQWYWNDVIVILIVALIPMIFFRLLLNYLNLVNSRLIIVYCICAFLIVLVLTLFNAKYTRELIASMYKKFIALKIVEE